MKNLILSSFVVLGSLVSGSAHAFLGFGGTHISQSYPCIGLDGVPIPAGAMERQCCSNGHLISGAPQTCRAGFNTISSDAAGGAAFNMNLAQTTLGVAHDMNGTSTDINQLPTHNDIPIIAPNSHSEVSAVHGATDLGTSGVDISDALGNLAGTKGSGSGSGMGSGSGSGGNAGGGLGDGLGSTSGANGVGKNGKNGNGDDKTEQGKVVGGFAQGSGKDGNNGFGSHDFTFGAGDANGANGSNGTDQDLAFGEDGADATGSNGNVEGTIVDPANYFNLTNKSDDIFKIVSRRYTKKFKKLADLKKGPLPASVPSGASGNSHRNKPI
ncbi:MAG: hypothetical protein JST80_00940 [Bdellovibrionales bacterium]|nr:hypothetical protein [Bdellovibrionales bacterium]